MSQEYDGNEESNIRADRYCICSKNIWVQEKSDFVEAYIFVDGETITEILYPSSQQSLIEQYLAKYPLRDYGHLYIFPGLVDINVSLHIGSEWEEIEQTTELYLKGGVTTIACQPLLTSDEYLKNELESIRYRKQRIANKSDIDYCFLANIYPENMSQLEPLYNEPGVAGFKIYLTSPFQNGAGWVETKKDMDLIMKRINDLRLQLGSEENSPTLSEKNSKQFQYIQKSLLVTFHSIKSGDKELTITSPLRQRKIEERCDTTTQIKRTQGDSVLGETHKEKKNLEINYDNDDQFDNLTTGQISECINDNILNLKNDRDTSDDDEELNQSELNPEHDDNKNSNTLFKDRGSPQNNQNGDQPHVSSQSNREKIIKMYAKASINSTENLQIKLIARAEMQTYAVRDNEDDSDQEKSISSDSNASEEEQLIQIPKEETTETHNGNGILKITKIDQNSSFRENEGKLEKSISFCSPISSPSSQRFDQLSPKSELCSKERRKESQESTEDIKILDQLPFPSSNQSTYSYEIEGFNDISKNLGKVIKMQKVQQEDNCNTSQAKDEVKIGSLHKIDENADSARDSNSDYDEDNSLNESNFHQQKFHKQSYNEHSDRSGSGNSHYLLNYKTNSLQAYNSKRNSHDIPSVSYSSNSEGLQMKLIKDMKRGSCDKDPPSFVTDHSHGFKKSNFNLKVNKEIQSMEDINKKEGTSPALLIPPNASKMRFSEKRRSMNLVVQVDINRYNRSESVNTSKLQPLNDTEESDVNAQENPISIKSSGLISDQTQTQSMRDVLTKNPGELESEQSIQSSQQLNLNHNNHSSYHNNHHLHPLPAIHHSHSSNFLAKLHQERDEWQENQIFIAGSKEDNSTRKQSTDSGSTHSIGNHILNQSTSSIAGGNINTQTNLNNPTQDQNKLCDCDENQQCKCQNKALQSNKSKFNQDYLTFLAFRPPYWEYFGIQMVRESVEKNASISKVKLKVVFANIGNSNSMYRITTLKQDIKKKTPNIHLYSETAGAYLFFSSNKITNGSTIFKCEPPIGGRENREFLVNASKLNMVDVVSSYHFPVDQRFKCLEEGDFRKAFSGICTAGFTLQATWTALYQSYKNTKNKSLTIKKDEAAEQRKTQVLLKYLVNMLSTKPAKILNIHNMKGSIQKGKYADFVVWDPFSSCSRIKIPPSYRFQSVHIFDKRKVYGHIHATILRGKVVYNNHQQQNPITIKQQGKLITKSGVM